MLNFNILTGQITRVPILRFIRQNTPVTEFTLSLGLGKNPLGTIAVICQGEMAMAVAQYLQYGDYVVIEGLVRRQKYQYLDETWMDELHFLANDVLKCEVLLPEEESN